MTRLETWLFAPGSGRKLAAVRIGLCSTLAFRLSRPLYLGLSGQPRALYRPLSFMHLFGSMPSRSLTQAAQIVGVTAAVLAATGLLARITLPAAWACGILLNGMATSIGKVVHNDVLLLLALVPLLAAPTSEWWSLDALLSRRSHDPDWSARYGWPVKTAMVVAAGGYFFTGLSKLVFSGPAWALSSNLRWALYQSSDGRGHPNALAIFIADRPIIAHLVAALTLVIELGFPLVLLRPKLAWFFVPAAVGLHIAIRASMDLDYSAWAATIVVLFTNWPAVIDRLRSRLAERRTPDVRVLPV